MSLDIHGLLPFLNFKEKNDLLFLVQYGSKKEDADIDLLIVYRQQPPNSRVVIGRLDISAFHEDQFVYLLKNFDFLVTEPLLTGDLLVGDPSKWKKYREDLNKNSPKFYNIRYLIYRSFQVLSYCQSILNNLESTNMTAFLMFWNNLSFSVSYAELARLYLEQNSVITFDILSDLSNDHNTFLEMLKNAKSRSKFTDKDLANMEASFEKAKTISVQVEQKIKEVLAPN